MTKKIVAGIALNEDVRYLLESFLFDSKYFFEHIDIEHYTPRIFSREIKPYAVFVEEDSLVTDDVKVLGKAKKVPVVVLGNSEREGKKEDFIYVMNFPIFSVKLTDFLDGLNGASAGTRYIATRKPLKGKKIMVFEDSKLLRENLKDILVKEGAEVVMFDSTENFIDRIKQHRPDVILLDIMIKPHDGFDVLDKLRRNPQLKEIPVVVASIKNYIDDQKTSLLLGAEEFLPKPFQAGEVRRILTKVLARR